MPAHDSKNGVTVVVGTTLKRANAFYEALLENGGAPMGNQALMEAARKHGSKVKQSDAVTTYLKQDYRFVKTGRGEWGLK